MFSVNSSPFPSPGSWFRFPRPEEVQGRRCWRRKRSERTEPPEDSGQSDSVTWSKNNDTTCHCDVSRRSVTDREDIDRCVCLSVCVHGAVSAQGGGGEFDAQHGGDVLHLGPFHPQTGTEHLQPPGVSVIHRMRRATLHHSSPACTLSAAARHPTISMLTGQRKM